MLVLCSGPVLVHLSLRYDCFGAIMESQCGGKRHFPWHCKGNKGNNKDRQTHREERETDIEGLGTAPLALKFLYSLPRTSNPLLSKGTTRLGFPRLGLFISARPPLQLLV